MRRRSAPESKDLLEEYSQSFHRLFGSEIVESSETGERLRCDGEYRCEVLRDPSVEAAGRAERWTNGLFFQNTIDFLVRLHRHQYRLSRRDASTATSNQSPAANEEGK